MEDVAHIKNFLDKDTADKALAELSNVEWHDTLVKDDGTTQKLSRKMAYMFEYPVDYRYAGLTLPSIPWENSAAEIRRRLEGHTFAEFNEPYTQRYKFNSVLLNLYQNGRDVIRWHSDKERQLGKNPVIACINLGVTRMFSFVRKRPEMKTWEYWNEISAIPQEIRKRFIDGLSDADVTSLVETANTFWIREREHLVDPAEEWPWPFSKELYHKYVKASIITVDNERVDYMVSHGDLILMGPECQSNWLHSIPEDKSVTEPRLSLTYRLVPVLSNAERCEILASYPYSPIAINEVGAEPVTHYVEGVDFYSDKVLAERTSYSPRDERYSITLHLKHISLLSADDATRVSEMCEAKGLTEAYEIANAIARGLPADISTQQLLEVYRHLKSKHYAMPFGRWSVEELCDHKIYKLKRS